MRYDDPLLLDALAREYVIGTLPGRARARFARVLSASLPARRAVANWERQLAPLAFASRPVDPPRESWARIEAALGVRRAPSSRSLGSLQAWRAIAAGLAAIAVLLGVLNLTRAPVEQARYVAIVTDAATGPVWLLQAFEDAQELRVRTLADRPAPIGNAYELWMLPDGGMPVSLGLIPGMGNAVLPLTTQALATLARTMTLAISLEPAGGSPTGQPTGPVIFTAPLVGA